MDIWNYLSAVFIGSAVVLIVYSAIRWVGVLGADRDPEENRKKSYGTKQPRRNVCGCEKIKKEKESA